MARTKNTLGQVERLLVKAVRTYACTQKELVALVQDIRDLSKASARVTTSRALKKLTDRGFLVRSRDKAITFYYDAGADYFLYGHRTWRSNKGLIVLIEKYTRLTDGRYVTITPTTYTDSERDKLTATFGQGAYKVLFK